MITIVTGNGRCGSSAMMQMLHLGGLKCGGEWSFFEDRRATTLLPEINEWMSEYDGGVLKVLDPHRHLSLPPGLKARVIWLDRDNKQQVHSWVKFQKEHLGLDTSPKQFFKKQLKMIAGIKKECLEAVHKNADERGVLKIKFENMIQNPLKAATMVANHLAPEHKLEPAIMAKVILKRNTKCMDGFLENLLLKLGSPLSQGEK